MSFTVVPINHTVIPINHREVMYKSVQLYESPQIVLE